MLDAISKYEVVVWILNVGLSQLLNVKGGSLTSSVSSLFLFQCISCHAFVKYCFSLCSATSAGSAGGQMKRMYSAVPGRVYVATRAHSASGDRELSLNKGDKVKGEES